MRCFRPFLDPEPLRGPTGAAAIRHAPETPLASQVPPLRGHRRGRLPTGPACRAFAHRRSARHHPAGRPDSRRPSGWPAPAHLPANRLLGIFIQTENAPAASGGVWDRVRAVQNFDAAMQAGDTAKIAADLPDTWDLMRVQWAGSCAFAALYGADLARLDLQGAPAIWRVDVALLSPAYETAAQATGLPRQGARAICRAWRRGLRTPRLPKPRPRKPSPPPLASTTAPRDFAGPMLSEGPAGRGNPGRGIAIADRPPGPNPEAGDGPGNVARASGWRMWRGGRPCRCCCCGTGDEPCPITGSPPFWRPAPPNWALRRTRWRPMQATWRISQIG